MSRKFTSGEKTTYFFLSLHGVLLYTLFFLIPVGMGIFYSLTDWNGISQSYNIIGLENYRTLFTDARVYNALKINFSYMAVFVVVVNTLAMVLALLLHSESLKFKRMFRAIYFFPAVISMVVVGLIFDQIFYHVIPRIGDALNIEILQRNILGKSDLALWGVLGVSVWRNTAVPMVLLLAGLQTVPGDLIEAAILDGTNAFQRFRSVILPFLIPVLNMTLILTIRHGIMVFDVIKATTNGGPGRTTEAISILVYNTGFESMRFGYASTQSILLFFIIAVISFVQIRLLKSKEVGQL